MRDPKLKIVITADGKQYSAVLNRATGQTSKFGGQAKSTAASVNLLQGAMRLLGGYLTLQGARALINTADRVNALETRVRTATKASGDFNRVWKELGRISVSTGAELSTTVSVFQGLARSAPELGATNTQMLALTQTVQQLGVISGASTASMRAGLLQFSQGLASGVFRAEEFNSLLENMPEVAVRIANGLGHSVGELRKMVLQGQLASRDVFQSLAGQAGEISAEFAKIPPTVERSATALKTTLSQAISDLDKQLGGTKFLALYLQSVSGRINELSNPSALDQLDEKRANLNFKLANAKFFKEGLEKQGQPVPKAISDRIAAIQAEIDKVNGLTTAMESLRKQEQQRQEFLDRVKTASRRGATPGTARAAQDTGLATADQLVIGLQGRLNVKRAEIARKADEARALEQRRTEEALAKHFDSQATALLNERDARLRANQETLEILRDRFSSEREITDRNYAHDLASFKRLEEAKTGTASERLYLRERIEREHAQRIQQINEREFAAVKQTGTDTFLSLRNAVEGWSRSFADALLQGGNGFTGFVDTVVQQLARIAIAKSAEPVFNGFAGFLEKVLTGTAPSLFGGGGSFAGGSGPALGSFLAAQTVGIAHRGGVIGSLSESRQVSPNVFIGASRYHRGGLVRDEVPIIARRGEEVLTRADPRHRNNVGQQQVRVEIVNRGAPKEVQSATPRFDPTGIVVRIIQDDMRRGGPISSTLGAR